MATISEREPTRLRNLMIYLGYTPSNFIATISECEPTRIGGLARRSKLLSYAYLLTYSNFIATISECEPTRIGGPQTPVPVVV